eukprot:3320281-Alexandrium_andersonii.AAC.1
MIGPALSAEPGRARVIDSVARRFEGHFTGQHGRPWATIHRCPAGLEQHEASASGLRLFRLRRIRAQRARLRRRR